MAKAKARKKSTPVPKVTEVEKRDDIIADAPIPDPASIVTSPPPPLSPPKLVPSLPKRPPLKPLAIGDRNKVPYKPATRCIYFRDGSQLQRLDDLRERFPRATTAAIIQQLVEGFLEAIDTHHNSESREIPVVTTVYL